MRNLDSITFDATNFIFHGDEDGVRIWHNAAGDGIGLYYFPIPPDIPADLDSLEDVRSAYRKLAATSFNLEDFRAGRHIVRDKRGWRVRDIQVESMWLARIEPSFHQLSYLMVVH